MTMNNVKFRAAQSADEKHIADLHTASWRIAYRGLMSDEYLKTDVVHDRQHVWQQRFGQPKSNQKIFVAEDVDGLAGFVCAYGGEDPILGTFIDNLHVRPDIKRNGVGKCLLETVAAWSVSRFPEAGMYLEVLDRNEPATAFYRKLGANKFASKLWQPPGGGELLSHTYIWSNQQVIQLGANQK